MEKTNCTDSPKVTNDASIPDLPREIICYQILPRLPAKSLMRFKSICSSWFSLIDDDSFADAYVNIPYNRDRNPTNLLFFYSRGHTLYCSQIDQQGNPTPVTQLSIKVPRLSCLTFQSINGLVCASMIVYNNESSGGCVFNPTTKQYIQFPISPWPLRCHHHFGFSPRENKYKVLEVAREHLKTDIKHLSFNIFTLSVDSSWRQLEVNLHDLPFDHQKCDFNKPSVCLHGAIHWVHETDNVIVVFDLVKEKFRVIPMPEHSNGTPNRFTAKGMIDVNGYIAVHGYGDDDSFYPRDQSERTLVLLILKDCKNHKWVEETISMSESCFTPLCIIHTGELAIMTRSNFGRLSLWLYNMKSKDIRNVDFKFPSCFERKKLVNFHLNTSYEDSIIPL